MSDFPPSKFLLGTNPAARGARERLVPARTAGRGARCCARLTSPPSSHLWAALAANPAGFVGAVSREKGASAPWWPSPPPSWPREALGADKRMQRQVQRPPPTAGERNLVWKSSFGGFFFQYYWFFSFSPGKGSCQGCRERSREWDVPGETAQGLLTAPRPVIVPRDGFVRS